MTSYTFTERAVKRIKAVVAWAEAQMGRSDRWRARSVTVAGPQQFLAKITANGSLGNNRWSYTFEEVQKTSAGYGVFSTVTGGQSGTAYNTLEDMNSGAGVEGNGVDVDGADFPAGFSYQPIPTNNIVWMRLVSFFTGTDVVEEYWFTVANGIDGTCEAP